MPLEISRNDIRNIKVDAIVNPSDIFLSGAGATDKIIHQMAGEELDKKLESVIIKWGDAIITDSFNCPNCKYIIHTCGPIYQDGSHNEDEVLATCYKNCLSLAKENNIESIAFPLIASGSFMFPKGRALKIATDSIIEFLLDNEMMIYLLVYDKQAFDIASKLYTNIKDYLATYYKEDNKLKFNRLDKQASVSAGANLCVLEDSQYYSSRFEPDESFSECLIRMIDERGLTDPVVYKKANIDRKHFNHIKNKKNYKPKKETAVALAIGLQLDINDTNTLLERAGFVLSNSSKFDLIIKYCIENEIYNIYQINEILFEEDQKTLGC